MREPRAALPPRAGRAYNRSRRSEPVADRVAAFVAASILGSLAQLVEQRTLNPLVEGSIPSRPTILHAVLHDGIR